MDAERLRGIWYCPATEGLYVITESRVVDLMRMIGADNYIKVRGKVVRPPIFSWKRSALIPRWFQKFPRTGRVLRCGEIELFDKDQQFSADVWYASVRAG